MTKERCAKCKFWDRHPELEDKHEYDAENICRRNPPVFIPIPENDPKDSCQSANQWAQPVTYGGDWCGEFKPIDPAP